MRRAVLLSSLFLFALPARSQISYAADVWPYRVERKGNALEYTYDLTLVRGGHVTPDAREALGEERLASFVKSLPREVRVSVDARGAGLTVFAPGGVERSPLAASFAATPTTAFSRDAVLAPAGPGRLLPDLHPDTARLLPSVEMVLWKAQLLLDGSQAALELAADSGALAMPIGRRELWARVVDKAVDRHRAAQGDAKEGAAVLAARVGVATSCLDEAALPAAVRRTPAVLALAQAELEALKASLPPATRGYWSWTRELRCAFLREQVLARPLPSTRPGAAAALVFLSILGGDARLEKGYAAATALRDGLHGTTTQEELSAWRKALGKDSAQVALDDLGAFLTRLESVTGHPTVGPPLLAWPETPVSRFVQGLEPAERAQAADEIALALSDGRLALSLDAPGSLDAARLGALAPLVRPEDSSGLQATGPWRARLATAWHAVQAGHREADEGPVDDEHSEPTKIEPRIRLMAPPAFVLEPPAAAYGAQAASLRVLSSLLERWKGGGLSALLPDGGRRPDSMRAETSRLEALLGGLEQLALEEQGALPSVRPGDVAAARRFLSGWMNDPDLSRDVRVLEPVQPGRAGDNAWTAIYGVGRRRLEAAFALPPAAKLLGLSEPQAATFAVETRARQRYVIPVLVTGAVAVPAELRHDRPRFRSLCDRSGRVREQIEASLVESLAAPSP